MLNIPNILDNDDFLNAPLDYVWEEETSTFYYVDAHNEKIGKALWSLNHKATFGIATALGEWIYWRLSKSIDRPRVIQALEAQWAGLIDNRYFIDWKFENEYISNTVDGPIWSLLKCIQIPRRAYKNGYIFINQKIPNLALLARHISPNKELFDFWLENNLKKSAENFPAQYSYKDVLDNLDERENEIYNSSKEVAIPREFFWDNEFNFSLSDNAKLINTFLGGLDYENSVFLVSPEEMKAKGFSGTPYQYK